MQGVVAMTTWASCKGWLWQTTSLHAQRPVAGDIFCRWSVSSGLVQQPVQIAAALCLRDLTLFVRPDHEA
jgi:hypothetical protein